MKILVINAGSSSVKYALFAETGNHPIAEGIVERIGIDGTLIKHKVGKDSSRDFTKKIADRGYGGALEEISAALTDPQKGVVGRMSEINAVGHRVVHGGEEFSAPALVDGAVKKAIEKCIPLAPLHNPANYQCLLECEKQLPGIPQVAVFDTAFFQTLKPHAYLYALPYEYYERDGIRRYGFHGTSHKFVTLRCAELLGGDASGHKYITAHLGNGCSIAAVDGGRAVDVSMGLTPLPGLVMGTRSGDMDPAIIFHLARVKGMKIDEIDKVCNKQSGLLGLAGIGSGDFRDVCRAREEGKGRAAEAFDVYVHRLRHYIGAYTAILGGLTALVFTAGVGENSPLLRSAVCRDLECLGLEIDEAKNRKMVGGAEGAISKDSAKARIMVIPTAEDLMIVREVRRIVGAGGRSGR